MPGIGVFLHVVADVVGVESVPQRTGRSGQLAVPRPEAADDGAGVREHGLGIVRQVPVVDAGGRVLPACREQQGDPHSMHGSDPELYTRTITEWAAALP